MSASYHQKRNQVAQIIHDAMLSQHKATLSGDSTRAVKIHDVTDEIMRVLDIRPPKETFKPTPLNVEVVEAGLRSMLNDAMKNRSATQFDGALDKFVQYVQQTDPECADLSAEELKLGIAMPLLYTALSMK